MSIDDLIGGPRRSAQAAPTPKAPARGRVVVGPTDEDDGMSVVLVNYSASSDYEVAPGHWMPRGDVIPAAGDDCLVIFDDEGDAWVPAWG